MGRVIHIEWRFVITEHFHILQHTGHINGAIVNTKPWTGLQCNRIIRPAEILLKGIVRSTDLLYFLLFIFLFLVLSIRRLDTQRLRACKSTSLFTLVSGINT